MSTQQREFRRLLLEAMTRLQKLAGALEVIGDGVSWQHGITPWMIDSFYDRWYRAEDALTRLKATAIWRSVDVEDDFPDDE